jgi:F-type H+-transporting ATPase subunit gamma
MPSLKDIRSRIETTRNTQQITKAMKMVSAAKLRRAQHNIVNMRPYAHSLLKVIADISATQRVSHPLLESRDEIKKVLLVVLTSDRGLCGAFNSNINRYTENYLRTNKGTLDKVDVFFIGRKGLDYFSRRGVVARESYTKLDKDISYELAATVAEKLMTVYLNGEYDAVYMIYNEFKSAIQQSVVSEMLLPVDVTKQSFPEDVTAASFSVDMIFEPEPQQIIDQLMVKHFAVQVYRCMSESVAAEHGARMTAMENATNNARDMLNSLTLTYNKLRQASITTELIEIVSGAEALKV